VRQTKCSEKRIVISGKLPPASATRNPALDGADPTGHFWMPVFTGITTKEQGFIQPISFSDCER
jgi:hypothetical protein